MDHILYVNSSNRNTGTPENFSIDADPALFNTTPGYAKVTRVNMPYTWYNINANNNKFILVEGGNPPIPIDITPGNYTFTNLGTAVQSELNASTVSAYVYAVVPDLINMKYTITTTGNFNLNFNTTDSMYKPLGFPQNYISTQSPSITSILVTNVSPYSEIFICSNIVEGIDNGYQILSDTALSNKILFVLPVLGEFGSDINYVNSPDNPKFIVTQSNLGQKTNPIELEFYLLFANGEPVDLNGGEWSMDIVIYKIEI